MNYPAAITNVWSFIGTLQTQKRQMFQTIGHEFHILTLGIIRIASKNLRTQLKIHDHGVNLRHNGWILQNSLC